MATDNTTGSGSTEGKTNPEPITLQKAASGLVDPKNTIKSLVFNFHTLLLGLVILGGVHLFQMVFPPKATNSQKQVSSINVGKDSGVNTINVYNKQEQDVKKKTVGLAVAVSSVDAELGFVKYLNDNSSITLGPRFGFGKDSDGKQSVTPFVRYTHDF